MKCQYQNLNFSCERNVVYFFILTGETYYCCCEIHGSGREFLTLPSREISEEEFLTHLVLES